MFFNDILLLFLRLQELAIKTKKIIYLQPLFTFLPGIQQVHNLTRDNDSELPAFSMENDWKVGRKYRNVDWV